jgi:hypothetical protein
MQTSIVNVATCPGFSHAKGLQSFGDNPPEDSADKDALIRIRRFFIFPFYATARHAAATKRAMQAWRAL